MSLWGNPTRVGLSELRYGVKSYRCLINGLL